MDRFLGSFSDIEFQNAYNDIRNYLVEDQLLLKQQCAYILGGQPGAGKSNYFLENTDTKYSVILNGDDYRKFHPKYDDIVNNDIQSMPDKTQEFCNTVIEHLIDDLSQEGYNMVIEGTLRNPDVPIKTCTELKSKKYNVNLVVIACDAEIAWKSTLERAQKMAEHGEYPRFVSIDLYDAIVSNIVTNLEKISSAKCFDSISIINRDGTILYPNEKNLSPSDVLKSELNCENWEIVFEDYKKNFKVQKQKTF